jgi:hypothetical protein
VMAMSHSQLTVETLSKTSIIQPVKPGLNRISHQVTTRGRVNAIALQY